MKALHVFPLFGNDLFNGSEYYEYMLTKNLVRLGVEVEVCTTFSRQFLPTSAFSLHWENSYDKAFEQTDGLNIRRFPVTFSTPPNMGHIISRLVFRRWEKEENKYGTMLRGSRNFVDCFKCRATSRPLLYDYLTLLGRGPHSMRLTGWLLKTIHSYDVVLVGFVPFALIWYLTKITQLFKKPLIILPLFHPNDVYHHFQIFYHCFSKATAILSQTPYSNALFKRLFPQSNPVQVGVGIDKRDFINADISGARFRSKHNLEEKRIILFVGRKEQYKRYDMAVQAVDMIDNKQVILVMIGSEIDRKPIDSPYVLYLGNTTRQELLDAYDACDVFVLPSEHESFGIVFLEAWMRKKPVIGNAGCEAVASIIQNGEDGFLCGSSREISERINTLVSNPALSRRLGEAGYAKTLNNYTWDIIAGQVYGLYRESCIKKKQ